MITRDTTFHLLAAAVITAIAMWQVYRHVPGGNGAPRSRLLINADIDKVESFTCEIRDRPGIACRKDAGVWIIERPIEARADDESIQRLLDSLAVAPVKDVLTIDEQQRRGISNADCGLSPPAARLTLRGKSIQTVELLIGSVAPHGQCLYAGFAGTPKIWMTSPDLSKTLPASAADIRDHHLLPAPVERLNRIELRPAGSPPVSLVRNSSGKWMLKLPEEHRASDSAVSALLDYIIEARIDRFIRTDAGGNSKTENAGIAFGCTPEDSQMTARFWFDSDGPAPVLHELIFGNPAAGEPDKIYAFSKEENLVVTVPASLPVVLKVSPDSLRDRRLFETSPSDITEITIRSDNSMISLSPAANGAWSISKPFPAPADNDAVGAIIRTIFSLRDSAVIPADPAPAKFTAKFSYTSKKSEPAPPASVARYEDENGDVFFDWYFAGEQFAQRVSASDMPPEFGSETFFASLRNRAVFTEKDPTITGISLFSGTNSVLDIGRSSDGTWKIPAQASAGTNEIARFCAAIPLLKAESVVSLVPSDISAYGLLTPEYTVTITMQKAPDQPPVQKTILIGDTDKTGRRFIMPRGQESVFAISEADSDILLLKTGIPEE